MRLGLRSSLIIRTTRISHNPRRERTVLQRRIMIFTIIAYLVNFWNKNYASRMDEIWHADVSYC